MSSDDSIPGLREQLVTERLATELSQVDPSLLEVNSALNPSEVLPHAIRHANGAVGDWLRSRQHDGAADIGKSVNELCALLGEEFVERFTLEIPPTLLEGIREKPTGASAPLLPERPQIPLTTNELMVNDRRQPSLGSQLRLELESAADVDLICAFVIWSGVNYLVESIRAVVDRGGRVRVITTSYMGVTQPKALLALEEAGAEIRVAYDAQRTKLHAKAWIIHRPHGLTTAFLGSSNLSRQALHDGLEWNVRLAEAEASSVIDRMGATFATYWDDPAFEPFSGESDVQRLADALMRAKPGAKSAASVSGFGGIDVVPYPHQRRMLEDLVVQRERHDRHRNLVVAATGTGKTIVAALDYRGLCDSAGKPLRLLFVAHREQILNQSKAAFQAVMKDSNFGEILGGGKTPVLGKQVFAMIQSLRADRVAEIDPEEFDVVIVDEFHHAEAPSYEALLEHLNPSELLGLTATPERMDGKDVTKWFGGRIAVELRLWEAIDQGYLAPFQYFGISDSTDLRSVAWKRGGYDTGELSNVVTGNHLRAQRAAQAMEKWHPNPSEMRALGFCVSVAHAKFMAEQFTALGISSRAITGETPEEERLQALQSLRSGDIRCLFSVDVLGEGVDVPNVDTILLLRPTQSATVFSQQLGRGLRLSEGKAYLTVIDLIGQQHRRFRFEEKLGALVDRRNGPIREQAESGFPFLPSGCSLVLDRESSDVVLSNLRQATSQTQWNTLVEELRELGDVNLDTWAENSGRRISDLYRSPDRSWTRLRRDADLPTRAPAQGEEKLLRSIRRLDHIDDPERTKLYTQLLAMNTPPEASSLTERDARSMSMLAAGLQVAQPNDDLQTALNRLWDFETVRDELIQLFTALGARSELSEPPLEEAEPVPIALHASYTRQEVLLALGDGAVGRLPSHREGVRWLPEQNTNVLFVTLRKSMKSYSPSTMYRDYAISRRLFHWESQNATHDESPRGIRFVNQAENGTKVILFVREEEKRENGAGSAFLCLGYVDYASHTGNRPMQVTWELREPLPEALLDVSRMVAAA